jgi:hypothetical protein
VADNIKIVVTIGMQTEDISYARLPIFINDESIDIEDIVDIIENFLEVNLEDLKSQD